ncbi:zinc metalloproteinase-disintegrin-like berythractivase [Lampris incognitus]|uniref:zinc metalloproteinase-disintegrin-like berythractivase n=1 Tax=Lampris incognitus TaxID=2546036 RepID=UPI0024B4BDF3|nr:zinc metalloproteinase-disintegrin-like berythractivase [Lampris incognitus]
MTYTLLLWILTLTASLEPTLSLDSVLEDTKDYELIRPVRLHAIKKRHTEDSRPETLQYAMKVDGKNIEMHLEKNRALLSKDYSETYYLEDGTSVTTSPQDIDHCYYHGRIVNDSSSTVSISTCDGLRGYFRTSAQKYLIEPLSGEDEGDHAVMKYNAQNSKLMVCGVTNTTWSTDYEPPTSRSRSRAAGPSLFQQQKYLELYIVADHREYLKMKKDQAALRKRIFEVVNFVNMVYKPLHTFVALVGLEVWSNGDLISVTPPAGATLDAFTKWRNTELVKKKQHDNAQLISGIDFDGATVGLAFIGTLCSDLSTAVVQDHNSRSIAVGATMAHEMGHNLGMHHDDSSKCVCSAKSCIMAAALSWDIPRSFSSCSTNYYDSFLLSRNPQCLLNKPDNKELVSPPVCGNGFLETGEECDCGTVEECINPCCNATTCTLTEGSQCAAGECCGDCKILPRSRECRRKNDDCDLAEYCDGESSTCPEDVFTVNGFPCDGGQGYCYNGQCPKRADQCVKMYGPTAVEASKSCYNNNRRGVYYAFCKRPPNNQFIPCQPQDVMCGKLFCSNGNANPNYGIMVTFSNCKAAFFKDYKSDNGQVDTGTKCGEGKVCSQNECVDLQMAYRAVNCSAKCPGYAVCNHKSLCQCEPGWLPPNCDTKDGSASGLSTEGVTAIAVVISLLILGAIAGAVGFLWKRRQGPTLPTTVVTQKKHHAMDNPTFNHNQRPVPSQSTAIPQTKIVRPKGAPPPPPPAGNKPKPPAQNYVAARQALRPVPPPKV